MATAVSAWTFQSTCSSSNSSSSISKNKKAILGHSRSYSLPLPPLSSSSSSSIGSTGFLYHSTSPTSARNRPSSNLKARTNSDSSCCTTTRTTRTTTARNTSSSSCRSADINIGGAGYSEEDDFELHASTPRSLPRAKTIPFNLPRALVRLSSNSSSNSSNRSSPPLPSMAEFEEIGLGDDTPEASPVRSFFSFSGTNNNNINTSNNTNVSHSPGPASSGSSRNSSRSNSFSRRSQATKQTTLSIPPTIPSVPSSPISAGVHPTKSLASVASTSSSNNSTTASASASNPPGSRSLVNPTSSASPSPATPVHGGLSIPAKQSRRKRSTSPSRRSSSRTRTSSRSRLSTSSSPVRSHPPQFQHHQSSPNLSVSSPPGSHGPSPFPRGQPPQRSQTTPAHMLPTPRLPSRKPRKTVEEMERECDEDSDDDIPENTVFWNIPLSPRAGKSIASTSPSPERLSLAESRQSISTNNGDDIAVEGESSRSHSFGRNGASTPPQRNFSTTSLPLSGSFDSPDRGRKKVRGKSWSDVMLDMGEDAKDLTEALERHAESEMVELEKKLHKAVVSGRTNSPLRKDDIKLPPKQRHVSVVADPIPVSKEKEAVLSRTRPGWLPPKDPEEEKKHLKEYQEMMRLSLEAERKKAEKLKKEAETRVQTQISINKVWEEKILPNWDDIILEPETRELWWNGVAPKLRGQVWRRAFGNVLAVGDDTFQKALQRGKKREADLKGMSDNSIAARSFHKIRYDVKNTLVDAKLFQEGCALHQNLIDVLMAYSMYRSDIGYVYGLNVIAANLLLNMSPAEAFITLANILNRPLPLSFYSQDEGGMTKIYALFLRAFQYKLPQLYNHIHVKLCLPPPLYLEPMFSSLFALHLPIDVVNRIWDIYGFEGDALLIRAAVATMGILESRLYGTKEEVLDMLGWDVRSPIKGPEKELELGKEDDFMNKVRLAGKEEMGR